jgi:hypothetical protein
MWHGPRNEDVTHFTRRPEENRRIFTPHSKHTGDMTSLARLWEDNIKKGLPEIVGDDVSWIDLSYDMALRRYFNADTELCVPHKQETYRPTE